MRKFVPKWLFCAEKVYLFVANIMKKVKDHVHFERKIGLLAMSPWQQKSAVWTNAILPNGDVKIGFFSIIVEKKQNNL